MSDPVPGYKLIVQNNKDGELAMAIPKSQRMNGTATNSDWLKWYKRLMGELK